MRISLLLAAALFCSIFMGCSGMNKRQTPAQKAARLNPHDPMMTSRFLKTRAVP